MTTSPAPEPAVPTDPPGSTGPAGPTGDPGRPAAGRSRFAPAEGTVPVAPLGRRLVALAIDWAAAVAISMGFFDYAAMATLAIFAVMTVVLVGTLGSTIGHLIMGMGVRAAPGTPPGPLRALVRTALLCLVIPAVVWGPDGRGLHDIVAGTTVTRIR